MRVNFLSLGIVVLLAFLVSGQVQAKPPQKLGTAVKEFFAKTHPSAYLALGAGAVISLSGAMPAPAAAVVGCGLFLVVRGICNSIGEEVVSTRDEMRDEFVQGAIDKQYVGEVIHYVDDGSHYIDTVKRSLHRDTDEVLVLEEDGKEISIEVVVGVGHPYDHFGNIRYNKYAVFSTEIAQPLNDLAVRLVEEEGHGMIEGSLQYFFENDKVSVEVAHNFTEDRWKKAQFLIDRDKILLP